ncbi:MAG: CvpA family protein [Chromatiales bacterium]|nr:CvpA family protein [Chromatiales bacterium]
MFDTLSLIYLAWGGLRGARRGPAKELHSLIGFAFALTFLLGFSVFTVAREFVESATGLGRNPGGLLGTALVFGMTFFIVRSFRGALHDWIDNRWTRPKAALWGMSAGALRNALVVALFIAATDYLPFDAIQQSILENSTAGRVFASLFPTVT